MNSKLRSWKTTTFGLMAAIGSAVITAIRTGVLDGSTLPNWVNAAAGLCSIVGSAGLGFSARDNNVTSEDAGASQRKVEHDTAILTQAQVNKSGSGVNTP